MAVEPELIAQVGINTGYQHKTRPDKQAKVERLGEALTKLRQEVFKK